ncbi:MAG: hypothetical protein GY810_29070 [Aureispira sp.]|nr:hypothetical protein [Aureispira sp.]
MKNLWIFLLLGSLFFTGCSTTSTNESGSSNSKNKVTGTFRSVSGVMNELSCHCSDGGYVKTEEGESVAVCFKKTGMPEGDCATIEVEGTYKNSKNNPEPTSPCPKGEMQILMVSKYTCK